MVAFVYFPERNMILHLMFLLVTNDAKIKIIFSLNPIVSFLIKNRSLPERCFQA
jgi:hypothetical protein